MRYPCVRESAPRRDESLSSKEQIGAFGNELRLDAEVREQLGLEPQESIRVLHSSGSTLVLERDCGASPAAVPWDRDLVLSAEVRAFPLADVLGMIHAAGKSGFLYFRRGEIEKAVYFHRGEVVFATSNQTVDRIGECLLRNGIITLQQLRDAERCFQPPGRFGKVLVQRGILTPRGLWNGVKMQVEEVVRTLFAYTGGTMHFWEGEVQPDNVVRLSLPTRRLIAEGTERRDELFRLLAALEDPRVTLERVESDWVDLAGNERAFLQALEDADPASEARTFAAICRQVGLDPLSGARTVHLLSLIGAVRILRGGAGPVEESPNPGEESVRAFVLDHVKLLAELTAPLVAVDGADNVAQRLATAIGDVAPRHPELLEGLEVRAGGALDPEELSARALRLPSDRIREVAEALGELASYLEFELCNHPRIQEPEHFLEAVEELRSRLEV